MEVSARALGAQLFNLRGGAQQAWTPASLSPVAVPAAVSNMGAWLTTRPSRPSWQSRSRTVACPILDRSAGSRDAPAAHYRRDRRGPAARDASVNTALVLDTALVLLARRRRQRARSSAATRDPPPRRPDQRGLATRFLVPCHVALSHCVWLGDATCHTVSRSRSATWTRRGARKFAREHRRHGGREPRPVARGRQPRQRALLNRLGSRVTRRRPSTTAMLRRHDGFTRSPLSFQAYLTRDCGIGIECLQKKSPEVLWPSG